MNTWTWAGECSQKRNPKPDLDTLPLPIGGGSNQD